MARPWRSVLAGAACVLLFVYGAAFSVVAYRLPLGALNQWPRSLLRLSELCVLGQRWSMFSNPAHGDYRFLAVARLADGTQAELFRGLAEFDLDHALELDGRAPSQRWMLALAELQRAEYAFFREPLAAFLARGWNADHPPGRQAESVLLIQAFGPPPHHREPAPERPLVLAEHDAFATGQWDRGRRVGHWVIRYADGSKQAEGSYHDGEKDGPWTFWNRHGRIERQGMFRHDAENGPWVLYDAEGHREMEGPFVNGRKSGHWVHYFPDGRKEGEGTYLDDEMEGRWMVWWDDGTRVEAYFHGGVAVPPPLDASRPAPGDTPQEGQLPPDRGSLERPGVESSAAQN